MNDLLLSEEFEELPNIVRDNLHHDVLIDESYQEPNKTSPAENAQRVVELSEGYSPAECWALNYQGPDIWRVTGVVPKGSATVVARTDSIDTLIERVFQYENSDAPRELVNEIANRLNSCTEITMNDSMGEFTIAVVDRTGELGLADTIVFSNSINNWFILSASDEFLMTFHIQNGLTIDSPALITQAVSKFRDGSK